MTLAPPRHSLIVRILHWSFAPVLLIMIWSGFLIYWANDVYWPRFSDSFYESLGVNQHLAEGMAYHFTFMWPFTFLGLGYVFSLIVSGQWRELVPSRTDFRDAWFVLLHDLKLREAPRSRGKLNAGQRVAYSGVVALGILAVLTGLAIYKPVQLSGLKTLLGGYESARLLHFLVTFAFLGFLLVHVVQVLRAGWRPFRAMVTGDEESPPGTRSQAVFRAFGFLFLGLAFVGWGLLRVRTSNTEKNIPRPLRAVLNANAEIGRRFLRSSKMDSVIYPPPAREKKARANGSVGLESPVDLKNWRLNVTAEGPYRESGASFSLADLRALPKTEVTVEFRCIEGWSEVMSFAGVRFVDFLKAKGLGTRSGQPLDLENHKDDVYEYVGLETPDGEYFVSLDMESALNPQTLLAYEQNGAELTNEHGAPLRLYIPNKYGVKSLKRIGKITFADRRPRDYWEDDGYDWFIGL